MSYLFLNRDNIKDSRNIFDVFLLLYIYCKNKEGEILHQYSKDYETFHKFEKQSRRFLRAKMKQSLDLIVHGDIKDEAIKEYFVQGIEGTKKQEFIFAVLRTIDALYTWQEKWSTPILNQTFREYGKVYYINKRNLGFHRFYRLIRGLDTVGDRIENKLTNLAAVTKIHTDYDVQFVGLASFVYDLLDKHSVRVGVVPFRENQDKPRIETKRERDGQRYFCVSPVDDPPCLDRLEKLINELEKRSTDVVILPELTLSKGLLEHIKLLLGEKFNKNRMNPTIKLVVAGSFHEEHENRCYVLGPDGEELFCQRKMNRFVIRPGEIQGADEDITEDIDISNRVFSLFDCPFGRVATMICLDFVVPECYNMLSSLRVNCFLLPAMTRKTARFETNAFHHASASHAATFLSNAYNQPMDPGEQDDISSFIFRPIIEQDGDQRVQKLKRHPEAFETLLMFDSEHCGVETVLIA